MKKYIKYTTVVILALSIVVGLQFYISKNKVEDKKKAQKITYQDNDILKSPPPIS